MGKLNVLLLVNRWYPDGGVENFLEQLVESTNDGVEYTIASLTTEVDSQVTCKKIGPVLASCKIQDMFACGADIRNMMAESLYDAVHIQASNGSAFFLASLARDAGISKRIIHSHNAGSETALNPLKRLLSNISTRVWCAAPTDYWACSSSAGEYLFGNHPFTVFYNGIDIDRFTFSPEKRARIRAQLGVSSDAFLLGSIGRISSQKAPLFQLQVFANLVKIVPNAKFCMVGSGDLEEKRNIEIGRLDIASSIICVSRTSESDAFYSAFDALILPSVFEGLPFVGIEGQAEGLPVYGSDALPKELAVTDLISFDAVSDGPAVWARRIADGIKRYAGYDRASYAAIMAEAGFARGGLFCQTGGCLCQAREVMSKRVKVLMVGPARNEQGGIATVVNDYFQAGVESHCDVTYLSCTVKGSKIDKLTQGLKSLVWQKAHIKNFDVLHVHMGGGNSFARERSFAMAGVRAGIPTILHVHDGLFGKTFESASDGLRRAYRKVFSSVDRVIALSESWRSYFEGNAICNGNVCVLPNGINPPEYAALPKERGTILFLGHFDGNKNADILIRAVALAKQKYPNIRCYFGADGNLDKANNLVSELGVESECKILGWVGSRQKQELLDRCSIYCLPSKNEAFPMGLLEAMANCLAPVVTPVGGMKDIIVDGETGLFVNVDSPESLADALVSLIADETRRDAIATRARSAVIERYSESVVVDDLCSLYAQLACNKSDGLEE